MNCLETRRLTLINPNDDNPLRLAHLKQCVTCARFARQLAAQDNLIREATKVEIPDGFAARILLNQSLQQTSRRPVRWAWLGLAASLLLSAVFLPPIARDAFYGPFENKLISHLDAHDIQPAAEHPRTPDPQKVRQVLASTGTRLPEDISNIISATTCVVDGEVMAHLLVQQGEQQYTVFVMPENSVNERTFQRADWSGQISHVNDRSIAVMSHSAQGLEPATNVFSAQFGQSLPSGQTI